MKRRSFFLCLLLLFSCSSPSPSSFENWAAGKRGIRVLCTTGMIDAIVKEIGQERVSSIALIAKEVDPHSYELVKGDDEKFALAQLIFYNGLGLEHGASLRYQIEHHPHAVSVGYAIRERSPEKLIYVGREIDPHIWMDISLWSEIIESIVAHLSAIDAEGKEFYASNGKRIKEKMAEAHRAIYEALQQVPKEKRYLVTSHDAFNYFTRAYLATPEEVQENRWQARFDAPEGLAPEGQLSASDIQEVIAHLIRYQIHTVFPESNVSRDALKKIVHACAQKGLAVAISSHALYGDAMGEAKSDQNGYLHMLRKDADILIEAWE